MRKRRLFVVLFGVFMILFSVFQPFISTSEDISQKIFRLHIIANSDSTYDQDIKLKLKNYFLTETGELFTKPTLEENIEIAKENRGYLENLCNSFLKEQRCTYLASVAVCEEFFTTRLYDDFTLPSGVYNSIKITLGRGEGHNWWCIVFPSVCMSACSRSMDDYLTDEEMELVNNQYTPKFKIAEIYEKIKYKMNY